MWKISFLKFQLTHFSKQQFAKCNLRSQVFLEFATPSRGIDFKLTSDVFRIFGGVDLFRLSVFVVKYFSFCQISWFTSVCFLLCFCFYWYWFTKIESGGYTFCLPTLPFAPFVMFPFSVTGYFGVLSTSSDSKTPEKWANYQNLYLKYELKTKSIMKKLKIFNKYCQKINIEFG